MVAGPGDAIAAAGLTIVGEMTEAADVKVYGATIRSRGYDHFA